LVNPRRGAGGDVPFTENVSRGAPGGGWSGDIVENGTRFQPKTPLQGSPDTMKKIVLAVLLALPLVTIANSASIAPLPICLPCPDSVQ
jgi:hypothetical protein